MIPEALFQLNKGAVIAVIGAGGKTTAVHRLRDHYRAMGWRVLVTTTTHMISESPMYSDTESIKMALTRDGYAFAAIEEKRRDIVKAAALPENMFLESIKAADITIVEADGARCLSFKVPKDTEPVIPAETTHILLVGGMWAVGKTVKDGTYNAEGLFKAFPELDDSTVITPELMARAYRETFVKRMRAEHPAVPLYLHASQDDTDVNKENARLFADSLSDCCLL